MGAKIPKYRIRSMWITSTETNCINYNNINTDSNYDDLNHAKSKHTDLIALDLPNNDLANIRALQKMCSWDRYLTDAKSSTLYMITPTYALSIHTAHTSSPVHSLHVYPLLPAPQIFTYVTSDPPSTSHN